MRLNVRQTVSAGRKAKPILLAIEDVTERQTLKTERDRTLAQSTRLIEELNHGVMNFMSMIGSVISMEGHTQSDVACRAAFTRLLTRIEAIATLYRVLSVAITHLSETELRDHHNQATTMATVVPQDPRFADWLTDAMAAGRVFVSEIEERIYAAALSQERGNMAAAARLVGLTRAQLAYRIRQSDDQADGARTKS